MTTTTTAATTMMMTTGSCFDATTLDADPVRSVPEPVAPAAQPGAAATELSDAPAPPLSATSRTWAAPRG